MCFIFILVFFPISSIFTIQIIQVWPYALQLLRPWDLVTFNASIAAVAAVAWEKTLQLLRELTVTMQGYLVDGCDVG